MQTNCDDKVFSGMYTHYFQCFSVGDCMCVCCISDGSHAAKTMWCKRQTFNIFKQTNSYYRCSIQVHCKYTNIISIISYLLTFMLIQSVTIILKSGKQFCVNEPRSPSMLCEIALRSVWSFGRFYFGWGGQLTNKGGTLRGQLVSCFSPFAGHKRVV